MGNISKSNGEILIEGLKEIKKYCLTIRFINHSCEGCMFAKDFVNKKGHVDYYCLLAETPDRLDVNSIKEHLKERCTMYHCKEMFNENNESI